MSTLIVHHLAAVGGILESLIFCAVIARWAGR